MRRALLLVALVASIPAGAQNGRNRPFFDSGYPDVHDPVLAFEDGRYYMFTTGFGVGLMSSDDMQTWNFEKGPLDPIPAWARESVTGYNGHTWAPDIHKVGDTWYMYYSCSSFGKNTSAIGVATSRTLDLESADYKWTDLGMVIQSRPGADDFNAIDPNLVIDRKGNAWLTFGSFWDGVQLVRLDKDLKTPIGKPQTIARRMPQDSFPHLQADAGINAIEAPFIVYKDRYYYLFVSIDYCCKGLDSNYRIAVGRSRRITGPYLDRNGNRMLDGCGEVLASETDRYSGIGHCGVYEFDGKWYIVAHAYDKQMNGASKLFLHRLEWKKGWPVIVMESTSVQYR